MKTMFASLATFAVLGVLSTTDVKISYYYDFDRSEMRSAGSPANREAEHQGEETATARAAAYDYIAARLGLGKTFSEIGRGMLDVVSFKRCWLREEMQDDIDRNVAGMCTALAGPL